MIYISTTQVLNGTVTISVNILGFEADNFSEAVQKLKNINKDIVVEKEDENTIHYSIPQNKDNVINFTVWGCMNNEPLKIIK